MFERIRRWYRLGLWTEAMVQTAAEKALLSQEAVVRILEKEESK